MVFHQSMARTLAIDAIPFTLLFRSRKEKLEHSLPCVTLRKMPFFSTSEVQRSFQWLEILSHLTGLNKIQFPDILEWMGNHNPPGSHLHPVPILTRQTNYLDFFFSKINFLVDENLIGSFQIQVITLFTGRAAKWIRQIAFMVWRKLKNCFQ